MEARQKKQLFSIVIAAIHHTISLDFHNFTKQRYTSGGGARSNKIDANE